MHVYSSKGETALEHVLLENFDYQSSSHASYTSFVGSTLCMEERVSYVSLCFPTPNSIRHRLDGVQILS